MITLGYENQTLPVFRVLTKDTWAGGEGPWQIQPMADKGKYKFGFEVLFLSRTTLPAVGEAKIRFRYGRIDGRIVAPSDATVERATQGYGWDSEEDTLNVPDLTGKEVRVQVAPRVTDGSTPAWRTCWWGECLHQQDSDWPGASIPSGERLYSCVDGFFRTKRWTMNRHFFYINYSDGTSISSLESFGPAYGHPGYNCADQYGTARGNKETTARTFDPTVDASNQAGDGLQDVYAHTMPGAGDIWTDLEVINHAINVSRPKNEPVFLLAGSTSLYSSAQGSPWEVDEGTNAWDFINNICRRERGRGCVFVDWTDDPDDAAGELTVRLKCMPQTAADITWYNPSTGVTGTINGATTDATTVEVDLIGDHRCIAEAFSLGACDQHRVDYLESTGERIQVLATLSAYDSSPTLLARWTTTIAGTFNALDPINRVDEKWRPVYQLYTLSHAFYGTIDDHDRLASGTARHRIDYRCDDRGRVVTPGAIGYDKSASVRDTSALTIEVMTDLPLLEGYGYSGAAPVRIDGLTSQGSMPRRPPLVLIRTGDNTYIPGEQASQPLTISVAADGIMIYAPSDTGERGAYRVASDTTVASLGASYNYSQVGCTVGLRMPHRVRMASTGLQADGTTIPVDQIKKRKTIEHPQIHLWLASASAIYDIESENYAHPGHPPSRGACGATADSPGVLRDDRGALAFRHALAAEWFLRERRTSTWALNACGFLPSFTYAGGGTTDYPTLGQLVTRMSAGGQLHTINTPITSVTYASEGVTTWATDWPELDFA
jgi:hypothetical protein